MFQTKVRVDWHEVRSEELISLAVLDHHWLVDGNGLSDTLEPVIRICSQNRPLSIVSVHGVQRALLVPTFCQLLRAFSEQRKLTDQVRCAAHPELLLVQV